MNFHLQIPFLIGIILSFLLKELIDEQYEDFSTIQIHFLEYYTPNKEYIKNTLANSLKKRYNEFNSININSDENENKTEIDTCLTLEKEFNFTNYTYLNKEKELQSKSSYFLMISFNKMEKYLKILSFNNNYLGFNKSLTRKQLFFNFKIFFIILVFYLFILF